MERVALYLTSLNNGYQDAFEKGKVYNCVGEKWGTFTFILSHDCRHHIENGQNPIKIKANEQQQDSDFCYAVHVSVHQQYTQLILMGH